MFAKLILAGLFALASCPHFALAASEALPWRDTVFRVPMPKGYVNGDKVDLYNKEYFRRTQSATYALLLFLQQEDSFGVDSGYGAFKTLYDQDKPIAIANFALRLHELRQARSGDSLAHVAQLANERASALGIIGRAKPSQAKVLDVAIDNPRAFGTYVRSGRSSFENGELKEWTVIYLTATLLLGGREVHVLLYRTERSERDFFVLKEAGIQWLEALLKLNP
jgi:hypothetical protein